MKSKRIIIVLLSITFFASSILHAQEQEVKGHVFTIQTLKVRFNDMHEYLKFWGQEWKPLSEQNEFILSQRVFTHLWGPDWTVITIDEYEDFSAIGKAQEKYNELWKNKYPDKAERNKRSKKFSDYVQAHTDAIVIEVPKLRK